MYCILSITGDLKRYSKGAGRLYSNKATAQRAAINDGDAVVEVHIDLDREPLFIRSKTVDGAA